MKNVLENLQRGQGLQNLNLAAATHRLRGYAIILLASTCLRQIFQAVEIDGEAYWDGGYRGNPSLYPLSMAARRRIW